MNTKLTAVTLTLFGALALFVDSASARPSPGFFINEDGRAGPKPGTAPDGSYVALNQSMASGYVSTVNPDSVVRYGNPRLVRFQGQQYWEIPVTYRHRTYGNGQIISHARALVRNSRVEYWVFNKSAIAVP
jgi:hypothetical protein